MHISCHGEKGSNLCAKMGSLFYQTYQDKGDFLLFEDPLGNAQPLTLTTLSKILQQHTISENTQCIFLAACYSRDLGKIFFNAGIPHVICTS